jgi:hypothetical protein
MIEWVTGTGSIAASIEAALDGKINVSKSGDRGCLANCQERKIKMKGFTKKQSGDIV